MNLTVDSLAWAASAADFQKRWLICDGGVSANGGRRGGRCYSGNAFTSMRRVFSALGGSPASNVAIVGVARKGPIGSQIVSFTAGGNQQVTLAVTADGALEVRRGLDDVVLGLSAPGLVRANIYYYIELMATIDDAAGTVDVQLNGNPVAGLSGLMGLDTQPYAGTPWTGVKLHDGLFCDLYVNDGSGDAPHNGFWGDTRVDPHKPVQDGPTNDWTPSAAGAHYPLLDEPTPNDDTDYIETDTPDAVDLVKVQDLINTGNTIRSCELLVLAKKTAAGACGVTPLWRPDATTYPGDEFFPSADEYAYASRVAALNPETAAAWAEADFNAGRVGVQKTS